MILLALPALLALLLSVCLLWTRIVFPRIVATTTGFPNLTDPAFGTHQGSKIAGTAIVCGGSIAGLLSSVVLARHFDSVVIVEAEKLPILHKQECGGTPENHRTRVMQHLHAHIFLRFLLLTYRKLFKDFDTAAKDVGARINPVDTEFTNFGVTLKFNKLDNSCTVLALSRDGLEPLLRRLVATQYSNITFRHGTVTSLIRSSTSETGALGSVRIRAPEGGEETLDAAFVVDATGPTSAGVKMLSRLPAKVIVPKTSYLPGLQYRTGIFHISEKTKKAIEDAGVLLEPTGKKRWDEVGFVTLVAPQFHLGNRFGFIFGALEGNRALMCIINADSDPDPKSLPTHLSDVLGAVRTISIGMNSSLKLVEMLVEATQAESEDGKDLPLVKIELGKCVAWDHVSASGAKDFPQNFVAVGDAFMRVDPIYGSGATKAAVDAVTLDASLRSCSLSSFDPGRFAERFFKKAAARNAGGWNLIKAEDYAEDFTLQAREHPWTKTHLSFPLIRTVWRIFFLAGARDEKVADQIIQVIMMIAHPLSLSAPSNLARVVKSYF